MIGLDVHVLVMDYTPAEVLERCKQSLQAAAEQAGYPVAVHFLPGVVGHLGRARANGYAMGSHPYVTHVDDDDWVESNAFAVLADHLAAGVDAITTGENHVRGEVVTPAPDARHHLAVYRRDALQQIGYSAFQFYPDQYALSMFEPVHIPQCVYNHRIYAESGSRKQRRGNPDAARRELAAIKRPDLALVENATPAEIAAATDSALREERCLT